MSDDEDEDDLWGDVEEPDTNIMLSANLAAVIGKEETKVHAGEPDEGQISWTAPAFAGLSNSDMVDVKGGNWNKEALLPVPPTPGTAAAMLGTSPPAKAAEAAAPAKAAEAAAPAKAAEAAAPAKAAEAAAPAKAAETAAAAKAAVPAVPPVIGAMPAINPTFTLPTAANGQIDWGAMMAIPAVPAK